MKKIIAMLLLTALMASAVLTSCSSDSVDNSAETTTAANAETTAAETEETRIPSNLPENADLEGYVMKYYGAKLQKDTNNSDLGIYASEQNGDTINDAVYKRDSAVMEKYNFDIKYIECTDGSLHPVKTIKPIILAGDDAYDAFLDGAAEFTALAAEGMLVDMRTLENMDLDSPWWPQTIVDSLTIGDSLYAVVGSHMMNVKTFLYVTLFNHKLAANFGIDKNELYNAAKDGTWTLDKLYSYAKGIKSDLNGDGKYDHNDLWGISGECYNAYTMAYGAGVDYVKSDSSGKINVSVLEEKNINIINDVLDILTDKETTLITEQITGVESIWTTADEILINDQILFYVGNPPAFQIREMDSDYGIIPSPKYNEDQDFYRHTTSVYNASTLMIPVSCADAQKVGFIQEAICYEAYYTFLPEFYKNFLETKYARDEETIEMLQIIHDTIYYDFSGILAFSQIPGVVRSIAETGSGKDTMVSKLTANADAAATKMNDTIKLILDK